MLHTKLTDEDPVMNLGTLMRGCSRRTAMRVFYQTLGTRRYSNNSLSPPLAVYFHCSFRDDVWTMCVYNSARHHGSHLGAARHPLR